MPVVFCHIEFGDFNQKISCINSEGKIEFIKLTPLEKLTDDLIECATNLGTKIIVLGGVHDYCEAIKLVLEDLGYKVLGEKK